MTSPRLATTFDWGRMYARTRGGDPEVPSITTVLDVLNQRMEWWEAWCATDAAIEHSERLVAVTRMPPGGEKRYRLRKAKDWIMEAANRDRDDAARRGDLVHDYAEQHCLRQIGRASADDIVASEAACEAGGASSYLPVFQQFWDEWQPRVLEPEATVWNSKVGYAGTTDLICELTVRGRKVIACIDWKTKRALFKANGRRKSEDLRDYTGMQVCAAARAEELWVPGEDPMGSEDTWLPFPYTVEVGLAVAIAPDGFAVRQYKIHDPLTFRTFRALRAAWEFDRRGRELMSPLLGGPSDVWLGETAARQDEVLQ